jgi:uncharacterized protein (DUF1015 family)
MVEIKPFKATILNPKLKNRTELICPVYDTIDTSQYEKYSGRENNVIHFTTRKEGEGVEEFVDYAKKCLERLAGDGILIERVKPSLYIYGIRYKLPKAVMEQIPKEERRATYFAFGLVALVKAEKLNLQNILGHEKTFEANTSERYRLMKECRMNFSPIAAGYNMPNHDINHIFEDYLGFRRPDLNVDEQRKPIMDVVLNGARHLLWEVSDEAIIERIQALMRDKKILILDGHHRYSASYRLNRDKVSGAAYTLMVLLETGDRAVLLLPWHRCVKRCRMEDLWTRIEENFVVEGCDTSKYEDVKETIYAKLNECNDDFDIRLIMYDGAKFYLLRADREKIRKLAEVRGDERVGLDVISLQLPRLTDVEYKTRIEKKEFPQKSTLFLPKVAEGVVMRKFGIYSPTENY